MLKATSVIVAASAFLISLTSAVRLHGRDINEPLLGSYDYIVVGCGISGLVVANRLSEIASRTVLCIEAGEADNYEAVIQDPVYVGADIGGIYDWDLVTVPQTQLDGATRPMPQGKVLGGGSILNAMCWNRGGSDDFDAWEALGNPGWGWNGLLPYFMKSETYTPVYSEEIAQEYSINYNPSVHGTSGPVQVSYPKYFYPQSINLFAGMNLLGLPTQFDPNDGTSAGPAFVPTDLDPKNQTRSDARRTYYDPYANRNNFHVITGQHVTRILVAGVGGSSAVSNPTTGGNDSGNGPSTGDNEGFGFGPDASTPPLAGQNPPLLTRRQDPSTSNLRIIGVELSSFNYLEWDLRRCYSSMVSLWLWICPGLATTFRIIALWAPSTHVSFAALPTPSAQINRMADNNASYPSPTELTTNATYNTEAEQEYETDKTGPWTAGSPNALAFNPLPLISNKSASILSNASSQNPTEYLVAGLDSTIVAGFTAQKASLASRLAETTVAAYEIINNNAGSLTVSVMHPFSRGTCYIQSADPFQPPAVDPRWLTNPVDRQVLIEALLFNRQILATPPMIELQAAQFVPPVDADEDAINQVINNGIRTEFHPSLSAPSSSTGPVSPSTSDDTETLASSSLSSASETVMVFTSILPATLPAYLSSLAEATPSPSTGSETITSPSPTSLNTQEQLSTSVIGVLTSAGIYPSLAASLVPVVIGSSPPEAGATSSASSEQTVMEQQQIQAAIDAFIQWLISFFHMH
ncbi:hypothetical protein P7C71_g5976, partial [Lecanoromycetidae sp. Uapishka_2]